MRKYFLIFAACSMLLCCQSGKEKQSDPDVPEEPVEVPYEIPCSCGDEWLQEETTCDNDRELPWDYPVKPGMEEWEKLSNRREAIEACQIPEDVLSSLTTEDLLQICLQYPLIFDVLSPSFYDRGLDFVFEQFNGIRELFKREDALNELLEQYRCRIQKLPFIEDSDASDLEKGYFVLTIESLELILSRYHASDDSKEDYKEILQHLFCGYEIQIMCPIMGTIGFPMRNPNFFSRARLIVKIDEQNLERIPQKDMNGIFSQFNWIDEPTMRAIDELSCEILQLNPKKP